jgi:hypothetical protein
MEFLRWFWLSVMGLSWDFHSTFICNQFMCDDKRLSFRILVLGLVFYDPSLIIPHSFHTKQRFHLPPSSSRSFAFTHSYRNWKTFFAQVLNIHEWNFAYRLIGSEVVKSENVKIQIVSRCDGLVFERAYRRNFSAKNEQ